MITITPTPQQYTTPPPPVIPNMSVPPPGHRFPPPQRFHPPGRHAFFQQFRPYGRGIAALDPEFDGKRLRKSAMRKTVDYNSSIIKMLEGRVWQRDFRDRRALQPDTTYIPDILPPPSYEENAINAVTTRFVKTATNKMRCPVFCMAWTPEGRRLITGASSGEFTLWNGLTFNFETILQAHDSPVRTMVWSHNDVWMVTADHTGYVKYWQSNMNSVKVFLAHKEAIRGISFSPNDSKFATCSDDGTIRIWDFLRCHEERILRGHGADVKCVHWHPQKGLVISGSKDNQQPVKLWDPKTGQSLATLHAHKSTVMDVKWNKNGNWLITASRDHLLKLFDIRNLSSEVQTFRGHKKESSSVAWHPHHEGLFCSGGSDGAILFWHVGADKEVGAIEQAHDSIVWTLAWHPLGHILCSGSNDHTSKFWTRNRPGDQMRDKYNLNTLPASLAGLDENDIDDYASVIPGMGPEDKVEVNPQPDEILSGITPGTIPGLDIDSSDDKNKAASKKVPYSKPIPKNFQAQWNETGRDDSADDSKEGTLNPIAFINSLVQDQPGVIPANEVQPDALFMYNRIIPVEPGGALCEAIRGGIQTLFKYVHSGAVPELRDVIPYYDISDNEDQCQISDEDIGDENESSRHEMDISNDQMNEDDDFGGDKNNWQEHDDQSNDLRFQGMQNQGIGMPPPLLGAAPVGAPPPLMGFSGQGDGSGPGFLPPPPIPPNLFGQPRPPLLGQSPDMFRPPMGMDRLPTGQDGARFNNIQSQDMFQPPMNQDGGDMQPPNMNMLQGQMQGNFMPRNMGGLDMNRPPGEMNKPPPLLPPEEVQRYREMHRNKDDRSNKKGRGKGGFGRRSGGGKYGSNRSKSRFSNNDYDDDNYDDDNCDNDLRGDERDEDDRRNYDNGDYDRDDRHWGGNQGMQNDDWTRDEDDDDDYDEEGQIDDRDDDEDDDDDGNISRNSRSSGRGGRFNFNRNKFSRGSKRKNKRFDRPWKNSRGGRGSSMKRGHKNRGRGGGRSRGRGRGDRDRNRDRDN